MELKEEDFILFEDEGRLVGVFLNKTDYDNVPYYLVDNDSSLSNAFDHSGMYMNSFGYYLAVPEWEAIITAVLLTLILLLTVVGNILVILSVFTYKPLRIVQNFFIVSLAVADMTVAILVLPFNVAYSILGRWVFGIIVCEIWLTCDIMCCTASILNLCAIALDRYWAITDPINYAQQRTFKRVLVMIAIVWIASLVISSPPLFGWNDWPEVFTESTPCMLTEERGYVLYSSFGSFFIPLAIMTIVYIKIFIATRRRLRERAKASKLNTVKQYSQEKAQTNNKDSLKIREKGENERDSTSSDTYPDGATTEDGERTRLKKEPNGNKRGKRHKKSSQNPQDNSHLHSFTISEDSITETDLCQRKDETNHCSFVEKPIVITTTPAVSQFIEEKQRISLSKERKAARTLGIIMGVFVVCWLPFFLMYVILPFCPNCPPPSKKVVSFITWLGYINSALNPLIYTIFNLDFKRAFKRLLRLAR